MWKYNHTDELYHYGRKGMKWGQDIFGDDDKIKLVNPKKNNDKFESTAAGPTSKPKTYLPSISSSKPKNEVANTYKVKLPKEDKPETIKSDSSKLHVRNDDGSKVYTFDGPGKIKADKNPGGWKMKDVEKSIDKEVDSVKKKQEQPKKEEAPKQEQPKKELKPEVEQPKNSVDMKTVANVSSNVGRNLSTIGQAVNQIPTNRPRMDLSQMTNKEMQERINRENLERQYNQLFSEPTRAERGKQKVSSILSGVGTALTVAGSALAIAVSLKQLRKKD